MIKNVMCIVVVFILSPYPHANAATMFDNIANCQVGDLTIGGESSHACAGYLQKDGRGNPNPDAQNVNALELFGHGDWQEVGSGVVFSNGKDTLFNGSNTGEAEQWGQLIIAFKIANGFSAYYLESDFADLYSLRFESLLYGPNYGASKIQVLGRVSEVPLPSAVILYGFSLLSLVGGVVRRKRQQH
jgi:hypothetical protein